MTKISFTPDPLKDQVFLEDKIIINKLIEAANLTKKDTVIEIGAGTGNITKKLGKTGAKVIAFEVDKRFKGYLNGLPKNIKIIYEKAKIPFNFNGKIVANPPFSFVEPLLVRLLKVKPKKVILVVSVKTLKTIQDHPNFNDNFEAKVLFDIPKESFYPIPKTNSVAIELLVRH